MESPSPVFSFVRRRQWPAHMVLPRASPHDGALGRSELIRAGWAADVQLAQLDSRLEPTRSGHVVCDCWTA